MGTRIRELPERLVNRIAAGEVIERPAAVVKELVENALDAGARRIAVSIEGGGIAGIVVEDDGHGMGADDLALAVQRHCTSKLDDDTLVRIATLGFRGEALPSIGAAARLTIASRPHDAAHGHAITVEGGRVGAVRPAAAAPGTRIVVADLFFATPARRKFLKQARTEAEHAQQAVVRLAFAAPHVAMRCTVDQRVAFDLPAQDRAARVAALLGPEAAAALLPVAAERGAMRLSGFAASPAHTRAAALAQSVVVNGRPVADPVLRTALRVAYRDVIAMGRHAVAALYLEVPAETVDVNVHPAKTELRFQDAGAVRALVIGGVRQALAVGAGVGTGVGAGVGAGTGTGVGAGAPQVPWVQGWPGRQGVSGRGAGGQQAGGPGQRAPGAFGTEGVGAEGYAAEADGAEAYGAGAYGAGAYGGSGERAGPLGMAEAALPFAAGPAARPFAAAVPRPEHPLGAAVAQVLDTYVIAVSASGDLVLVDQHAAHERLTHEALLAQRAAGGIRAQPLLLPAVVDLAPADAARLLAAAAGLAALGLELEGFGAGAVLVRALPAALGAAEPGRLVRDVADALAEVGEVPAGATQGAGGEAAGEAALGAAALGGAALGGAAPLEARLDAALARLACHGSIRAGRRLSQAEMDALLRRMEATPRAATCSHGRPTVLTLSRAQIEAMFGRR